MAILEISNVRKTYNNKAALKGISLSINKGEFIALLGPNGAGKSTLISILGNTVVRDSGQIIACGYDINKDTKKFKASLGIVPQEVNFDPFFTPLEILLFQQGLYGLKPDKAFVIDLLDKMALTPQNSAYIRSLSGGMKRRLLVAKAIVHKPSILILDEPTAGVDVELRQHLWKFLKDLNQQGVTIILTTHYIEEAQNLCDKIAIINKGELITYENKNTLLDKIGIKTLEVSLDKPITDKLKQVGLDYKILAENKVLITYKDSAEIGKIIQALNNNDFVLTNLKIHESNLEDVFLTLTK
ncbi:ABC transporter ATP-binding protein [Candidatus Hepatincolaceae symbiont of Richtersius coronifer]